MYMYIYRCVLMCLCNLRDFSRFFTCFFFFFTTYMQILFRYMLCYNVIILIQILIRYNVKNLITACNRSLDFDHKVEKSPYPGRGDPSQTLPPLGRFAPSGSVAPLPRICHFSTRCPPNPLTHGTPLCISLCIFVLGCVYISYCTCLNTKRQSFHSIHTFF